MVTKQKMAQGAVTTNIDTNKISSSFWNVLWRTINDNVSDPKHRSIKWVWSAYPDEELENANEAETIKEQYPLIVIEPVLPSHEPIVLDQNMRGYTIPFSINVFSDRSDHLDAIHDNVDKILYDNTSALFKTGITNITLVSSSYDYFMRSGVKVHHKTLDYEAEVTKYS